MNHGKSTLIQRIYRRFLVQTLPNLPKTNYLTARFQNIAPPAKHAADLDDDLDEFGADFDVGRYDLGMDAEGLARIFASVDGELPDFESDYDSDCEDVEFADCPKRSSGKSTRLCRTTLAQCILRYILMFTI